MEKQQEREGVVRDEKTGVKTVYFVGGSSQKGFKHVADGAEVRAFQAANLKPRFTVVKWAIICKRIRLLFMPVGLCSCLLLWN